MLAAGNTKITDLLCETPPAIPEGAHAMTQLVELPPADDGLGPHRHSGPVFGYMLEGRILFELEGEVPRELVAGEAFWEPGGDVVHYQMSNLDADGLEQIPGRLHLRSGCRHDHHARSRRDRGPRFIAPSQRPSSRSLRPCERLSRVTALPVSTALR